MRRFRRAATVMKPPSVTKWMMAADTCAVPMWCRGPIGTMAEGRETPEDQKVKTFIELDGVMDHSTIFNTSNSSCKSV